MIYIRKRKTPLLIRTAADNTNLKDSKKENV